MKENKPQKLYLTQVLCYSEDALFKTYYDDNFSLEEIDGSTRIVFLGFIDFFSLFESLTAIYDSSNEEEKTNFMKSVIEKDGFVSFLHQNGLFNDKEKRKKFLEETKKINQSRLTESDQSKHAFESLKEMIKELNQKRMKGVISLVFKAISEECDRAIFKINGIQMDIKLSTWMENKEIDKKFNENVYGPFSKILEKHPSIGWKLKLMSHLSRDKKHLGVLLKTIKTAYESDHIENFIQKDEIEQLKPLLS